MGDYQQGSMDPAMQGGPPPKQSHCLRNCLIAGCLLVFLGGLGTGLFFYVTIKKLANSFVSGPQAIAVGQSVAKGATLPAGYEVKAADISFFSFKAKGVIAIPQNAQKGTAIAFGAFAPKPQSMEEMRQQIENGMQNAGHNQGQSQNAQVVENKEEELEVGSNGATVKASRIVLENQQNKQRIVEYLFVLDPFPNEFGYLFCFALGPADSFDTDGFKAFLKTIDYKPAPGGK